MPNLVGLVHVDREHSAVGHDAWRRIWRSGNRLVLETLPAGSRAAVAFRPLPWWEGKPAAPRFATAALLRRRRTLVTTDTGIMCLGFAVRVPTLALLRPYSAHCVGSHDYGRLHRVALLDRTLCCGEDPPRVGVNRSTPDGVFPILREFWGAAA